MSEAPPVIGFEAFAQARRLARADRTEERRQERAAALDVLHTARARLEEDAAERGEAEAAVRDADALERLADRLVDWVRTLERDLDRLEAVRDQTVYRGPILTRTRAQLDARDLALRFTEVLGEACLSPPAQAVLSAAAAHAAL